MPIAHPLPLRLSDFDFALPHELIAQRPAPQRTASRLLRVDTNALHDLAFTALPDLLVAGDVLVFNDTRVIRSRLRARKPAPHGGKIELLLERIVAPDEAWMQLRASHPPKAGGSIDLPGGASASVLERDGRFELRAVNNGFDAGMMVKEYRPDLIVLDVMLPDINGKEVCQRVRSDSTMDDVRIICISGMIEADKVDDLKAAGANDFLQKPFEVDQLVDRICHLLDVETVTAVRVS